jgi:type I restriction enzyme S subunit
MTWPMVKLQEVLSLQRRWIKPSPTEMYQEIGIRSYGKGIFHKQPLSGLSLGDKRVSD